MAYNQTCILIQNCVGIGTDTPLGSLTVKQTSTDGGATGGISIINDNNELKGSLFAGGSAPRAYGHLVLKDASNCDSVMLRTTGGDNFILCGNFGIGTNGPGTKLTIKNKVDRAYTPNSFNDTLHAMQIDFCNQNQRAGLIRWTSHGNLENSFGVVQVGCAAAGCGQGDFVFQAYKEAGGGAYNELMRLTNTGNVGIGCTTPTNTLEVNGTGRFACTVNIGTSLSSASRFQLNFQNWNTSNSYPYITFQNPASNCRHGIGINTSDNFVIGRATGVDCNFAHQDFVIVNSTGNTGIGTCTPSTRLHISDTACFGNATFNARSDGGYLIFQEDGTTTAYLQWGLQIGGSAAGNYILLTNDESCGSIALQTKSPTGCNNSAALVVGCTGNVGVGTCTPSYRLHVNGTFYAAGSSQDYKQSICNYNTDSCMFMKLKPVTYQYKEEYCHLGKELKSGTQIGLIAEEVAETYPELAILVNEEANKVVRNVDYEKLSVILLSEVQKLRREVDDLKHKQ